MPILTLSNPSFVSVTKAGRPNSGGTIEVYVADGLFTTLATVYSDQQKTVPLTNPVVLDDAGKAEIWYEVSVDVRERLKQTNPPALGAIIEDYLNLDPNAGNAVVQGFNLVDNGSFEVDTLSDGQPDNWTITPYAGSAIAITETLVRNGVKALEFNTTATGTGGGTATSVKFPVTEGSVCSVAFSFYATNATTLNTFKINWYDQDDVLKSTSTVTMPASGSVPTSWTEYQEEITVDAAATQGEVELTGISSGGTNLNSKAYFDGISIFNNNSIVTRTGAELISPLINGVNGYGMVILDTPEVLSTATTAGSWVSSSGFASATLTSAVAKIAIIRIMAQTNTGTTSVTCSIGIKKAGSGDASLNAQEMIGHSINTREATGSVTEYIAGEGTVSLDSSFDFEYFISDSGATLSQATVSLVGYFV